MKQREKESQNKITEGAGKSNNGFVTTRIFEIIGIDRSRLCPANDGKATEGAKKGKQNGTYRVDMSDWI